MNNLCEFYLGFWGEVRNDSLIERDLGLKETDFWFKTEEARAKFKAKLTAVADKYGACIAFKEAHGTDVRLRTVAEMVMALPNGKEYEHEEDFGYAYAPDSARYMFEEGNYACDCSRTLLLSRKYPEVGGVACGDEIRLKNFRVVQEPAP